MTEKAVYEKEYYLRTGDFDWRGTLSPAAILDLFQDMAGAHANILGCGSDVMAKDELVWVVVKTKFQMLGNVGLYSKVKVRTWPMKPASIRFQREYLITDESGTPIVKGSSEWVFMHIKTRKLMPVRSAYPADFEHCTQRSFEGRFTRVPDFEAVGEGYLVRPQPSDLDVNGHVNNIKYANYVYDALMLGKNEQIDTMQIDYHREVKYGSDLIIHTLHTGDEILAKGVGEDGELRFSCRIELRRTE